MLFCGMYIYLTILKDLKTIRPGWLIKLNKFNDSQVLVSGAIASADYVSAEGTYGLLTQLGHLKFMKMVLIHQTLIYA